MSLMVYFLRHGETTDSHAGGYCGSLDPELTTAGFLMAEDFANAYSSLKWAAILSSPLRRAVATAMPLCEATGRRMKLKDGLKEIEFGEWEGKNPDDVGREFHDDYIRWLTDPGSNAPTGGQKGIDVLKNSAHVLEDIKSTYSEGNVLIVSHKATIRIMLCSLLGIDIRRFRDRISMPVGALSIVEMAAQGPLLHMMGDRSYLMGPLSNRPSCKACGRIGLNSSQRRNLC